MNITKSAIIFLIRIAVDDYYEHVDSYATECVILFL
jgi:hypothetical protein